jgi:hypothetical protein
LRRHHATRRHCLSLARIGINTRLKVELFRFEDDAALRGLATGSWDG